MSGAGGHTMTATDTSVLLKAALWYVDHGIPVFPCAPRDKVPFPGTHGFKDATRDRNKIIELWTAHPDANIAMPTGAASGTLVVDSDPRNGGPATRDDFQELFGIVPDTAEQISGREDGGRHYFFKHSSGRCAKELAPGVDIKSDGGYIMLAPSIHPATGKPYTWDGLAGAKALLSLADPPAWVKAKTNGNGKPQPIDGKIPHGQQHNTLVSLAGTMRRRGMGVEAIFAALMETNTSQCEVPGPAENIRRIAESACRNWQPDPSANAFRGQPDTGAEAARQAPDLLAGIHRDHGNGERLIAMYGAELRYCHAFKKSLWFDGQRWLVDECGHARDFAKLTAVEFLRQAVAAGLEAAQKFAKESLDSKRLNNMLLEAQSGLAISPADLDTHPYLLNFNNGTVDLKDGRLYPHDRGQFITKMVKYAYRPAATCPTFLGFLERIMGITPGASEGQLQRAERLIAYLQKAIGYSLTGTTCEKAVFLLYGPGDNGKSTLLALFLHLLEEYAVLLQIDSLMVRQESNNTQADLADLRGARFVMTSETEEGQRLAEGKLKRITQGMGKIKATRKYENPVEFNESHKLWIDANHLPTVRGTDNAIWNRLHPVPFTVTIPKAEQDRDLRSKLLAEAEGILAWAVAGAVRWHREGLGKPPEVEQAGAAWRTESDQTGRFLEACCIVGQFASVKARVLYQTYRRWCEEVGERAQPENICFKRLGEQGFKSRHTKSGNIYDGIGLLTEGEGGEGR